MALNKDVLGQARYNAMTAFNNQTHEQLIATYGSVEAARLQMLKVDSEVIINHFKSNAQILPTALIAPEHIGPVTGTGTIV